MNVVNVGSSLVNRAIFSLSQFRPYKSQSVSSSYILCTKCGSASSHSRRSLARRRSPPTKKPRLQLLSAAPMAANYGSEQEQTCRLAINHDKPINSSCFQMLKPSFDEINQQYSVDVFPVFVDKAPIPMRLNYPFKNSQHEPNIYSIAMLPEDASNLTVLSLLEVEEDPCKLECGDCIDLTMNAYAGTPCVVDIDIKQGSIAVPKTPNDEDIETTNSNGLLSNMQRVLRRQVSLKTGEKLMQILMDNSTMLLKLASSKEKPVGERAHDGTNNRWRRCKRAASFDSRKVVLLFSILSSFGTLILIYLTLKVRQNSDGFVRSW